MASNHSGYDGWRSGVEFQRTRPLCALDALWGVMLEKEAGRSAIRPGLAPTTANT
jgi:vanillate O-demethylase monooxygenase subunit